MKKLFLVLDQGGQSSRAALFDEAGDLQHLTSVAVSTNRPYSGAVEQDPFDVVQSLKKALTGVVTSLDSPKGLRKIQRAALVTQRSSIVCWDRLTGDPLSPILSWQDTRAADWLASQHLSDERIRETTGLYPNAHFAASKIHWCLNQLPVVQRARSEGRLVISPIASFLLFHLISDGSCCIDAANAARTMLYNIDQQCWDKALLNQFSIPVEILPDVKYNQYPWGALNLEGESVPVTLVNGDQNAAFSALMRGQQSCAVINAGTGAFIAMSLKAGEVAPSRLLKSLIFSGSDGLQFVAEGTVNGAASALQWLQCELGIPDIRALDSWCDKVSKIPLFLNGIGGLASPYWCADFLSRFVGDGGAEEKLIAVLESIVFLLQRNLEALQTIGKPVTTLIAGGGLTHYDCFCQKLSDVSGLLVQRSKIKEVTSKGAAWRLAGMPDWPTRVDEFGPSDESQAIRSRYAAWCSAMRSALFSEPV